MAFFSSGPNEVVRVGRRQSQRASVAQVDVAVHGDGRHVAHNFSDCEQVAEARTSCVVVDQHRVSAACRHLGRWRLRPVGPLVRREALRRSQRHRFAWAEALCTGCRSHVDGARHFQDVVVLVNRRVVNHRFQPAWPLDGGLRHGLVLPQAKTTCERASDAVALAPAHFAHHGAEVSGQLHLGAHRVDVAFKAFQVEGDPVVVVAVVHPKDVWVPVVGAHVTVAVAGVDVQLAVAVHVTRCEAVHGVVPREHVGHLCERHVAVVSEEPVRAACVDEVDKPVVVKVVHLGLQEEPCNLQSAARCDVGEMACAIVLQQLDGRAVVGRQAIEIAVVVDVCKVCGPALLVQHQTALQRFFCPTAVAVVHPELVDAAWVLRIVHELAALGDEQIDVSVAVEVRPHRAVVAAVVVAWVVLQVVVRQVDELGSRRQSAVFVALPHAAQGVVVTTEHVQDAVVVDVHPIACLHEHAAVGQLQRVGYAWCGDVLNVHAVVRSAREHVLVAVVVKIRHAHAPLAVVAHLSQVVIDEPAFRGLIQRVERVALVQDNQVVVAVAVHVRKSNAPAAVVRVGQQVAGVGERLGLGHRGGHRQGKEPSAVSCKCAHGCRFHFWSGSAS